MKHCPACNFSFPDFHLVCDFDGTELVPDRKQLALIKLPGRQSSLRRLMKSPKTLAALAIIGLFLTAAMIAYQQMAFRSAGTLLAVAPLARFLNTPAKSIPPASRSKLTPRARPSMRAPHSSPVRSSVAKHRDGRDERRSYQTEVIHRQPPPEKPPKFVAALKTTWRVLKRPFGF